MGTQSTEPWKKQCPRDEERPSIPHRKGAYLWGAHIRGGEYAHVIKTAEMNRGRKANTREAQEGHNSGKVSGLTEKTS